MSSEESSLLEINTIRFFELINLENIQIAQKQFSEFSCEVVRAATLYEDIPESLDIIWIIKDVINEKSGLFVNWKDTESFIVGIENICETQGIDIEIDWGINDELDNPNYAEDFFDNISIPELMETAYQQFYKHGLSLWNWNTNCDAYGVWITRNEDVEEMHLIADQLSIQARLGKQPF